MLPLVVARLYYYLATYAQCALKAHLFLTFFVFYKLIFIAFMFIKIEFHVYIIFFANNFKEKQKRTTLKQVKYTLRSRGQSALASGQLG